MGVKIVYSKLSKNDLKEIYDYIAKDSISYAKREISLIKEAVKGIKRNIFIGLKFAKFDNEMIRELIFRNYLIIYEISDDKQLIAILTIHHHSRLLSNNPALINMD